MFSSLFSSLSLSTSTSTSSAAIDAEKTNKDADTISIDLDTDLDQDRAGSKDVKDKETVKVESVAMENNSTSVVPPLLPPIVMEPSSELGLGLGFEEGAVLLSSTSTPSSMPSPSLPPSSQSTDAPPTTIPSYTSRFGPSNSPPAAQQPYEPAEALGDIEAVSYALELFLLSRMRESEGYLVELEGGGDKGKEGSGGGEGNGMERLYVATGYGLIQCVKGLMSYDDADLLAGIAHTKHGNHIAGQHRKRAGFLGGGARLAGYVVSSFSSALSPTSPTSHPTSPNSPSATTSAGAPHASASTVQWIKSMTDVERHAELVYAESLFEKALLGIVYSGDWLAFIKEALNMRTTISIYRQLGAYLDHMDAVYAASQPSPPSPSSKRLEDPSIDVHFRSGVLLGVGMCNIILSLMPGKLAALVELFGYKGDRQYGLECLMRAGGWGDTDRDEDEPGISAADEGVRRSICDMCLLIFHLVLSSFTFEGVDIAVASRVLKWNLKRYPNGVFFLFGAGRLALVRSRPADAIDYYTRAMHAQTQYRNLHHISYWEMAIAHLALWDVKKSLECWRELEREATWSKAIYSYGMAVCLLEYPTADPKEREKNKKEAVALMEKVPSLRQKIAGKSIPLEKLVARKARKFLSQKNRLAVPALEMAYVFQGIAHAPRRVIWTQMVQEVKGLLEACGWIDGCLSPGASTDTGLKEAKKRKEIEKAYSKTHGGGYWDDVCLGIFLRGVCMRYIAYPDPDADLDPNEDTKIQGMLDTETAAREAEASFRLVFTHGPQIELDHQLVYHAHYELARLFTAQGRVAEARHELELVLSGKHLEVGPAGKKARGRYSMENALVMRSGAALDCLGPERGD